MSNWVCDKCGTSNEEQFDRCWKCAEVPEPEIVKKQKIFSKSNLKQFARDLFLIFLFFNFFFELYPVELVANDNFRRIITNSVLLVILLGFIIWATINRKFIITFILLLLSPLAVTMLSHYTGLYLEYRQVTDQLKPLCASGDKDACYALGNTEIELGTLFQAQQYYGTACLMNHEESCLDFAYTANSHNDLKLSKIILVSLCEKGNIGACDIIKR